MKFSPVTRFLAPLLATAALLGAAGSVFADPPDRVARISYLGGEVSFAPAGEDSWYTPQINRPIVTGDRVWTNRGGRVELELGSGVVRLDQGTSFEFLNLDDQLAQIQLTEGTLNLRIDHLYPGQIYEIDTPTLAFIVDQPGEYRLDIAPRSESTQVTVFTGHAEVYGEGGRNVQVQAGMSYLFYDSALSDYERLAMPRPDDFDQWAFARNDRYLNSPTRRYVSEEMIGYADLDDYGAWRSMPDYGNVWFPRRVDAGWAPYRDGHWSWIDPWGWTWVDDQPWGFAPFHYGRWVYVSNGWGWIPGPRHVRPVYAPALVAFVGGSNWSLSVSTGGSPIGWFPLGPRDVYVPWYHCSRDYFGRVNVHNTVVINHINVTNIYNDYYVQGRPLRRDYTYRGAANAVTVVPRDSFVSARSAAESMSRLRHGSLEQGEVLAGAPAAPTRASLVAGRSGRAAPAAAFDRQVVARTQPAPRTAPFATRQQAIARNGGEPLASDQMRRLSESVASDRAGRVRVIGSDRAASAATGAPAGRTAPSVPADSTRSGAIRRVDAQPAPMTGTPATRDRATAPAAVRGARSTAPQDSIRAPVASEPQRNARSLPSSRYAPRNGNRAQNSAEGIPLPARSNSRVREPSTVERDMEAPSARYGGTREAAPSMRNEPRAVERSRIEQRSATVPNRTPSVHESAPRVESRAATREWTPTPRAEQREAVRQSAPAPRMESHEPVRQSAPVREAPARRESAPERSERSDDSSRSSRPVGREAGNRRER